MERFKKTRFISIAVFFLIILAFSVSYSALSNSLSIDGKTRYDLKKSIRVSDIRLSQVTGSGVEYYSPTYTSTTVSVGVDAPSGSTIKYKISLRNKSNVVFCYSYTISSSNNFITETITSSTNEIAPNSTLDVDFTLTGTSNTNTLDEVTVTFRFYTLTIYNADLSVGYKLDSSSGSTYNCTGASNCNFTNHNIYATFTAVDTLYGTEDERVITGFYYKKGSASTYNYVPVTSSLNGTYSGSVTITEDWNESLVYYAVDSLSTATELSSSYLKRDTVPPTLSVEGNTSDYTKTVYMSTSFTNPTGVSTDDQTASPTITTSGAVTPRTPGNYPVTYTATDEAGNTKTVVMTVTVLRLSAAHIGYSNSSVTSCTNAQCALDELYGLYN